MSSLRDLELYRLLAAKAVDDPVVARLLVCVDECFDDAVQRTKTVIKHMPEYTLHDEVHLLRVVELMGRIVPERTRARLRPLELAGLILSAAYHDIGMAPSDTEVRALLTATSGILSEDQKQYLALREAHPGFLARQLSLHEAGRHFEAQEIEAGLLVEHLRRTHAKRASSLLFERYADRLVYDNYAFCAPLAEVCFSHNEDPASLQKIPAHELVRAGGEYCNWRFVACVLRLADILDFDPKRTPHVLFEHLGIRHPISIKEWKKHRAMAAWDIQPGKIAFAAQCPDPVIEKCVRDFIRLIERELRGVRSILANMHDPAVPDLFDQYALDLPLEVSTEGVRAAVGPNGPHYVYLDVGFSLDEDRIISLLAGLNLYRTPTLFLRELLQNAVDACRHRSALHLHRPELGRYDPVVRVVLVRQDANWYIEIEDNGMGMDEHIVRNYFARVGRSYYNSGDFLQERARAGLDFKPVSQFGIGILSAFMAGNSLEVHTRRLADNAMPLEIQIANQGSLFWFNKGTRAAPGTRIRVRLTSDPAQLWLPSDPNEWGGRNATVRSGPRMAPPTLRSTIERLAPHTHIPIYVSENGESEVQIVETWVPSADVHHCMSVDMSLNAAATQGIEGRLRVYLLQDFTTELRLEQHEDPDLGDISDFLKHRWSYIEKVNVDRAVKEGLTRSYSVHASSHGRWSQHGFLVQHRLFKDGGWFQSTDLPYIPFPFPVSYDLNLLPPLALPLTAERNGVALSDEARRTCTLMAERISLAFFSTLGISKVRKHRAFFRDAAKHSKEDESAPFLNALNSFLTK